MVVTQLHARRRTVSLYLHPRDHRLSWNERLPRRCGYFSCQHALCHRQRASRMRTCRHPACGRCRGSYSRDCPCCRLPSSNPSRPQRRCRTFCSILPRLICLKPRYRSCWLSSTITVTARVVVQGPFPNLFIPFVS